MNADLWLVAKSIGIVVAVFAGVVGFVLSFWYVLYNYLTLTAIGAAVLVIIMGAVGVHEKLLAAKRKGGS